MFFQPLQGGWFILSISPTILSHSLKFRPSHAGSGKKGQGIRISTE